MTEYICTICNRTFDDPNTAFDHLVEEHASVLEMEYIVED